jgi:hypothetical protein
MRKLIAAINMTLDGYCDRVDLKLLKTKTFGCGVMVIYYEPSKK